MCFAVAAAGGSAIATADVSAREVGTECPAAREASSVGPESAPAAQADAASLLAVLTLPPGSTVSPSEPSGDGSLLAHPASGPPATPNVVDEHTWWLVPLPPAAIVAYLCERLSPATVRPAQYPNGLGGPGVPENEMTTFTLPGSPGTLVVWAVALPDGSTALRVDAQVVWITPRPAADTFPVGSVRLKLALDVDRLRRYAQQKLALLLRLPARVTSGDEIEKVRALLNGLRVAQPGLRNCPIDFGGSLRLTFVAPLGTTPFAEANIAPGGCGGVTVVIGGAAQEPLEGGWDLIEAIASALGVQPWAGLPIGSAPRVSHVRMVPARFRDQRGAVVVGTAPGSELRFDLSAPAEVEVAIGRLHGRAVRAGAPRAAGGRAGKHNGRIPTMRLTEPAGEDAIPLAGREGTPSLRPGRYVAVLNAANVGGRSDRASVRFDVKPGP